MCSLVQLTSHSRCVSSVAFSPKGEFFASGSEDGTIGVWRVSSGERFKTLTANSSCVFRVVFLQNGEYLASGSGYGFIYFTYNIDVWRVSSGELIKTFIG